MLQYNAEQKFIQGDVSSRVLMDKKNKDISTSDQQVSQHVALWGMDNTRPAYQV